MGTIITFVVIGIVLNILRSKWVWVDYIFYILFFIGIIGTWQSEGLFAAFVFIIIMSILWMIARGFSTKVNLKGKEFDIECEECGYNKTEIISTTEKANGDVDVLYHCPRCGTDRVWVFGRRK